LTARHPPWFPDTPAQEPAPAIEEPSEMIRTIAAYSRAHVAGFARPCALGAWHVQPKIGTGTAFMATDARRPSEPPT
jgi:hypothetical protein